MKIRMITPSLVFIVLIGLVSCGGNADYYEEANVGMSTSDDMASANYEYTEENLEEDVMQDVETEKIIPRKLIKTGTLEYEVENLNETSSNLKLLVEKHKAYIASEYEYTTYDRKYVEMQVRIPSVNFDGFVDQLARGVDQFENREISVQDVTEEFVDLTSRVATKKELEERFVELLDMATRVDEVLEIEREINAVRIEIESMQGRLNFISKSVDYSTLTLKFFESVEVDSGYGNGFLNALESGWNSLVWFVIGLVSIWPFLIIGTITTIVVIKKVKSKK